MNEDKIKFQIESVPEEKETVGSATYSVEEIPPAAARHTRVATPEPSHGPATEPVAKPPTPTSIK